MTPLDPWIIEEIKKREEEKKRRREERPQPQLPIPEPPPLPPKEPDPDGDRGVVIIDPDGGEEKRGYGIVISFI